MFNISEVPTGFTIDDITTTNGLKGSLTSITSQLYSMTITPMLANTPTTVSVAGSEFTNSSGDGNQASNTFTFTKI